MIIFTPFFFIVILDIPRMQEEFPASMGFTILPDEIVEAIKMNYPMDSIHLVFFAQQPVFTQKHMLHGVI